MKNVGFYFHLNVEKKTWIKHRGRTQTALNAIGGLDWGQPGEEEAAEVVAQKSKPIDY